MRRALLITALVVLAAIPATPCSMFCLVENGETLYGRNYDFEFGDAFVLMNQRGVRKHSISGGLEWTTRYASVTFNQFGKEFPMDGMNEAGLVVALAWLDGTEYPAADSRPRLGVLEWIQYQLDNHASVAEVLAHAEEVRIGGGTPLHYLIADRTGAAATIEYLGGRLVAHEGARLQTANLTNDRYDESLEYLERFSGFGGTRPMPTGGGSLDRFARTAIMMKQSSSQKPRDRAFSILSNVAQPNTRWSVVYDSSNAVVSWRTNTSAGIKTISMRDLDLSCSSNLRRIDAHTGATGDVVPRLGLYTAGENLQQLIHAYASTSFLRDVPREDIERTAAHAESFTCAPRPRTRAIRQ